MTSAGKWVLGLLLLVVGAVFVARTVSSDPGGSSATVKNNLPGAAVAGSAKDAKDAAAVEAAAKKKIASTIAGDVSCKKACIEVNEVAADSITTAKLAPGSVTLSKLAFEVPNLNELENEINARKAAEASVKAAQAEAAAAGAKNDAAITAAASNGITQEAAARTAADEALAKNTAAADADLLSKLNAEVRDRGDADNVLQGKLNTEIADRAGAINNLRSELGNGNQVAAPIVQINNNEIVNDAVTSNKILADTILAEDLATGAVTTVEILDDTVAAIDLAANAVVGRGVPADVSLLNVRELTLRGQRTLNGTLGTSNGDIALGTITGQGAPTATASTGNVALGTITGENDKVENGVVTGNLGLETVGRENLVDQSVDNSKLELNAVTTDRILNGEVKTEDIADGDVVNSKLRSVDGMGQNGAVSTSKINDGAVTFQKLDGTTQGRITTLESGLATEITDRIAAVTAEALARSTQDGVHTAAITAEALARSTQDGVHTAAISAEGLARTAMATALATDDGSAPTSGPSSTGLVHWNVLKDVPAGFADGTDDDGNGKVQQLENKLNGTGPGAGTGATTGSNLVSWLGLGQVPADFVDGDVSFSELSGVSAVLADGAVSFSELTSVPSTLTAAFSDNVLNFGDLTGAIGVSQIAADTVTSTMLAPALRTTITTLVSDVDAVELRASALEQAFLDLADSTKLTPTVASNHITGLTVSLPSALETNYVTAPIPAASTGTVELTITGVRPGDLLTVTPPSGLTAGVFVVSSDVVTNDKVTLTLYNSTASPFAPAALTGWKVRWLDLTSGA